MAIPPVSEKFDLLLFIGRFQPLHQGHVHVITEALARARQVLLLVGSAGQARSLRNPWLYAERQQQIAAVFPAEFGNSLFTAPVMDSPYDDDQWLSHIQAAVRDFVQSHRELPTHPRIGLIGHAKDNTTYYLQLFPQWEFVPVANFQQLSATPLREAYFSLPQLENTATEAKIPEKRHHALARLFDQQISHGARLPHVPEPVQQWLIEFASQPAYDELRAEQHMVQDYRTQWAAAPYAPIFVTVDAMVVQSGHILLIQRKRRPGKGLWALPGGFLDPGEWLQAACLRELLEETALDVAPDKLKASIKHQQVFDDPLRSSRGRTLTHAFLIELPPAAALPTVTAGDDAGEVRWLPLAELDATQLFEDHYFIIQALLSQSGRQF